jgi:hypothetical protein
MHKLIVLFLGISLLASAQQVPAVPGLSPLRPDYNEPTMKQFPKELLRNFAG